MKLFVGSLLLSLFAVSLPPAPEKGGKCSCKPSPPGAVIHCQPGQVATCNPSTGVCVASCLPAPASNQQPLQYSAALLSALTGTEVTETELKKNPKMSKKALEDIIRNSKKDKPGKFTYQGKEYNVGIGLSDAAKKMLQKSIKSLAAIAGVLVVPKIPGIRFP